MMTTNYEHLPKLSAEELRKRQREYWRRWKERHAPKSITYLDWRADFTRGWAGWNWKAKRETNGAELENGPFETLTKAKQDFYEAIG